MHWFSCVVIMDMKRSNKRKWLIYIASCWVAMVDFAIILAIGSLFVPLMERFDENRTTTATVQSTLLGTTLSSSVVSGILIKKIGTTRVSLIGSVLLSGSFIFSFFAKSIIVIDVFVGFLAGVGVSFLFVSSTVVVKNSFEGKAQDMAVSAHNVFVGFGSILYPYVFNKLTDIYTVNETFLILGGVFLNNFAITLLLFTNQSVGVVKSLSEAISEVTVQTNLEANRHSDTTFNIRLRLHLVLSNFWKQIVTILHIRYVLVLLGTALVMSSNSGYLIVFNDICVWKGFTKEDSLRLYTVFHASSAAGRGLPLVFSKLSKDGADLMILLIICAMSGCFGQICLLFSSKVSVAFAANIFAGLTQGGAICTATIVAAQLSSSELFGVSFGLLFTLVGVMILSFGPIYGYIRDSIQSYELAIILTAALSGVGAALYTTGAVYNLCRGKFSRNQTAVSQPSLPDKVFSLSFSPHTSETDVITTTHL